MNLTSRHSFFVVLIIFVSLSIFIGVVAFLYIEQDRDFRNELLAQDLVRITSKQARTNVEDDFAPHEGSNTIDDVEDDEQQQEPEPRVVVEERRITFDENERSNKLTGWKGRHMFHVTTSGRFVEGHILLRSLGFPFLKDPIWSREKRFAG